VGDVRGRGLLAGIELVQDQATRAPFPRSAKVTERLVDAAMAEGLIVWPNTGHADGTNGDLVTLAPPFVVTEEELDEIVRRLLVALSRLTTHD
jgi:adenosylmethionine-8-amino-7-oxononanoate aminotransferase